ncbi:MAG: AMP-binding protein, partial [Flavobacteriales bacterium]|nr:AMP-binding protein [Flavobacteriales bacterium]
MKEFLSRLIANDIHIKLVGKELSVKFPKDGINKEIIDEIKSRKQDLIAYMRKLDKGGFAEIPKIERQESYQLSSSQKRMWIVSQFEEINLTNNIPNSYLFNEELNIEHLEGAFLYIIDRHEILRTVFLEDSNGEVSQVVKDTDNINFKITDEDLRGIEDQEGKIDAIIAREMGIAFNLSEGPLLRVKLVRLDDDVYVLNYVIHHIISDGWSMGVMLQEILIAYAALENGVEPQFEPLRIQYKDFASWQQKQLNSEEISSHKQFWLTQFEGAIPPLELNPGSVRPPLKTYNGNVLNRYFNAEILEGIKAINPDPATTLFMKLLAGVKILLQKYTHQNDIVVGTAIAGREHADLENQIGYYLNALALRTIVDPNQSYLELLKGVKEVTLGAYEHQSYPFDELVNQLNNKRDVSRSPLYDVMVDLLGEGSTKSESDEGETESGIQGYKETRTVGSKFDLTFYFADFGGKLKVTLEYNTDIYHHDFAHDLLSHLEVLFTSIIAQPNDAITKLTYLTEADQELLLKEVNNTSHDYQKDKTLINLFEQQVESTPESLAVEFEGEKLTYNELNERANQLAAYLRESCDVMPNDLVGLQIERSEWMIISILAVLKSGGAYVPIDPTYPEKGIDYILSSSNCKIVIDEEEQNRFNLKRSRYSKENLETVNSSSDLAYVIFTSGSTGTPKGVEIEHQSVINYLEWSKSTYLSNDVKPVFGLF